MGNYRSKVPRGKQRAVMALAQIAGPRQVANAAGLSLAAVNRILADPANQQELEKMSLADVISYREQVAGLIPTALQAIRLAVRQEVARLLEGEVLNPEVATKILSGTQLLNPRTDHVIAPANPLAGRSDDELRYILEHKHLPEEPCTCQFTLGSVIEAEDTGSVIENPDPPDPDEQT